MGTTTEKLKWIVDADATSAIKAFDKTGDAAEAGLKKAETAGQKIGGQLTKVGAGAMAAAGIMGGALVKAAGAFEDTALAAGHMADATGLSVEQSSRWIEVAGDMGIGADTIESSVGKMNKTLGSTPAKFEELGIKIATTKDGAEDVNGTFLNTISRLQQIEDPAARAAAAAQIFGKGWQGAAELLKLSTDDIKTQLASVSDQKVIDDGELQKAKDYRADLDHLKDSAEDLTLAIGQGAAPMIGAIASAVGTAVDAFAQLDDVSSGAAGGLLAAGTAALGTVGALSVVIGQAIKLKSRFTDAEGAMTRFGKAAVASAGIAGVATLAYTINAEQAAEANSDLAASIDEISRATDAQVLTAFNAELIKGFFAGKDFKGSIDELAKANIEGAQRVRDHIRALVDSGAATDAQRQQLVLLNQAIGDEQTARANAKETQEKYKDTTEDATAAQEQQTRALELTKDVIEAVTERTDTWKRHTQMANDDIQRELDETSGRWDALEGNIADNTTWINLQQGFDDLRATLEAAGDTGGKSADEIEKGYRDAAIAVNDQKLTVEAYSKSVLGLPPERVTKMLAEIDAGNLAEVEAQLANLTRNRDVNIQIVARGGAGYGPAGVPHASGGVVGANEAWQIVGERGPEAVKLPTGSRVIPNNQLAGMGSVVIEAHFHGPVMGEQDFVMRLANGLINLQSRGVIPARILNVN